MKIIILTQNENLYLPTSIATVSEAFNDEVVCIVVSSAMSTHGGAFKGFVKHFRLFGLKGITIIGRRVMKAKLLALLTKPNSQGPFYSIKQVANAFEIMFHAVPRVRDHRFLELLDEYKPDLLISISCPQIIGRKIRERIPMGCINVHGAPLPKYRGLMPAFWALRNGEVETAVSVHDLEAKLDDGDILLQRKVEITAEDTWDSLVRKTKAAGAQAVLEAIEQIRNGTVRKTPNLEEEATYFSFPTAADRKVFLASGRKFF